MSNSRYTQFMYTKHAMPTMLDCNFTVGATGAVGTVKGPGISGVTRLDTGIYKIRFQENFNKYYGMIASFQGPAGTPVAAGSLNPTDVYTIVTLGTTTTAQWVTAGLPLGITPAVGATFLCAATSGGTGTAAIVGSPLITNIMVNGNPNTTIAPYIAGNPSVQGGYVVVQCNGPTAAGDTAQIPTDPANGAKIFLTFYLSNSSVNSSLE